MYEKFISVLLPRCSLAQLDGGDVVMGRQSLNALMALMGAVLVIMSTRQIVQTLRRKIVALLADILSFILRL